MEYSNNKEIICEELDCVKSQICRCSKFLCCTICAARCVCPAATTDPNKKMIQILGFGELGRRLVNVYVYPRPSHMT